MNAVPRQASRLRSWTRPALSVLASVLAVAGTSAALPAQAAGTADQQPTPGHTALVPSAPNPTMPKVNGGEIFDIEVVGHRAFVVGSFTSITNKVGDKATYDQAGIAAYDLDTGAVDTTFRPQVGGSLAAVEATPDGTHLFIGGAFQSVNGVARKNLASLDLTTGAPLGTFVANASSRLDSIAATNSTVYVGGRFTSIKNTPMVGLAALSASTGAVDKGFNNQLSGGIGVDGALTAKQLKLTHDNSTLVVMHTARRVADQDRYGVAMIDTATKQLTPWRTRLWEDNLADVGGIQRAADLDISPDDSYFVTVSGSGGDKPPLNDTAIAFPMSGGDGVQERWVSRMFDSVYSVAVTEQGVYVGGHMSFAESPTAPDPWPGLTDVGYGAGQGLSGYGLGDDVVRREHLAALAPSDGKALPWNPGSSSTEGCKAMSAIPRGLLVGCDGNMQGGVTTGRVALYDWASQPAQNGVDTTIDSPIEGRVVHTDAPVAVTGTATSSIGGVTAVKLTVRDRDSGEYLQSDATTWGTKAAAVPVRLASSGATSTDWTASLNISENRRMLLTATAGAGTTADSVPAQRKIESFRIDDLPPDTLVTSPGKGVVGSTSFPATGTATDDKGVMSVRISLMDGNRNYLQADGSVSPSYHAFTISPDVVGATDTTWHYQVRLPYEGAWRLTASAVDTLGQVDLHGDPVDWVVNTSAVPPTVVMTSPVVAAPPNPGQPMTIAPQGPMAFSGTAEAQGGATLRSVEVQVRNTTTGEDLASDGSWGHDAVVGWYRVTPQNLTTARTDWSFTTPFDMTPGVYTIWVRATDSNGVVDTGSDVAKLKVTVQVPGDATPEGTLSFTGTDQSRETLALALSGSARDDKGVAGVDVVVQDTVSRQYVQRDGTIAGSYATLPARLTSPGSTSTGWSLDLTLPRAGTYLVKAVARDTAGQPDFTTDDGTATATYLVYPGDQDPWLSDTLSQPVEGDVFTESRIVVSGRAFDDTAIQRVQVRITDAAGRTMDENGTFTAAEAWVEAFMTSPGSTGSQYAYTSPAVPSGAYKVAVRPIDQHGQYPLSPREVNVTVTAPASNAAPVAKAAVSCAENVCTLDARGTTDETPSTVKYSWSLGDGRTVAGPLQTVTYSRPGTFTITLTATDEYGVTGTASSTVTITEPSTNQAPTAVIGTPACQGLTCTFFGSGSSDPDKGDTITYRWTMGNGKAPKVANPTVTYAAAGTYQVTLTVTDGWGRSDTATTSVTVAP